MHSDWERGVDLQGSVGLHQGAALPSLGTSVVSALGWPASGDARLVTRKERGELRARAEKAGLLWVSIPAPSAQQRGQFALLVEGAIEERLTELGASPAGFNTATNLDASLGDQLYRARSIGANGLTLMFDTLARLTNLAGALDAEDSAVLRWWLRTASEKRVRLLFDVRDRYLGIYTRPVALESLLVNAPAGIQLDDALQPGEADAEEELGTWLTEEADYSPADLAKALRETSPPPPPSRLSAPPPPPRASPDEALLEAETAEDRVEEVGAAASPDALPREPSPQLELGLGEDVPEAARAQPIQADPQPIQTEDTRAIEAEHTQVIEAAPAAHSPEEPQQGDARQLAFRSVLAALEAIEHEELDESPPLPDTESGWEAAGAADSALAETPEPVAVPEPSPSSDGFTAMLTQEESPLPTRAIHYDSSAPSAAFDTSEYHEDALDRSSRAPAVEPIASLADASEPQTDDLDVEPRDESQVTVVEAEVAGIPCRAEHLAVVPQSPPDPTPRDLVTADVAPNPAPSLEVLDGELESSAAAPRAESATSADDGAKSNAVEGAGSHSESLPKQDSAEAAEEPDFEPIPDATWQAWVRDLEAARGPKPLAVVERLFTSAYMPLLETRLGQPLNAQADAAIESWGTAFAKSYSEAFDALRIRGKRPTMVLDVPDIALRHGRMHGARQAQLVLVDALRFDLGQMVHEHLKELAGRDAACVERLLLWSALPANTSTQLELLGRGPQGLREPVASERDAPVARGRAASTLRRVRAGHRDVMKLDLVESRIGEPGATRPMALWSLAAEVAEVLWDHMASLPPRTLVMIFGDHGFRVDSASGRVSHSAAQAAASPEEVMVPAFAWLTGSVH
ncbi:MAG: hypothetical protein KC766_39820 [Myxococcales bacterium]|nr:hypothetical protein [Myxococcales bacterium]